MTDDNQEATIPVAALTVGVPERSVYRAEKAAEIPSTTRDGVKYVRLGDVRAWAQRRPARKPGTTPAALAPGEAGDAAAPSVVAAAEAPSVPVVGSRAPSPPAATSDNGAADVGGKPLGKPHLPALDGPLWGRLFGLLIDGLAPEEIVHQMEIDPHVVGLAKKEFDEFRGPGEDPLKELKESLATITTEVAAARGAAGTADEIASSALFGVADLKRDLPDRLAQVERRLAEIEQYLRAVINGG